MAHFADSVFLQLKGQQVELNIAAAATGVMYPPLLLMGCQPEGGAIHTCSTLVVLLPRGKKLLYCSAIYGVYLTPLQGPADRVRAGTAGAVHCI